MTFPEGEIFECFYCKNKHFGDGRCPVCEAHYSYQSPMEPTPDNFAVAWRFRAEQLRTALAFAEAERDRYSVQEVPS